MDSETTETYYEPDDAANAAAVQQSSQQLFWRPQTNTTTQLRLGPPWSKAGLLFKVVAVHYGLKEDEDARVRVVCLNTHATQGKCPVCKYVRRLRGSSSKKLKALGRELRASYGYHFNVLVRGQDALGWRIWNTSPKIADRVMHLNSMLKVAEKPALCHPLKGRDVIVKIQGEGFQRTTDLKLVDTESAIGIDLPVHNLDEVLEVAPLGEQYLIDLININFGKDMPYA